MYDHLILGGTIVDGTGALAFQADVAIKDGLIAAVGDLKGQAAKQVIDATGKIVTPGFVDIHTHLDGQATWDDALEPSFSHGVTTVVMGNCGVGFAPVRPGEQGRLISIMEGVEDIPGTVLSEGIRWTWETFPEYLDTLAERHWTMDVAAQVPHCAVRAYVMGDRGYRNEDATAADVAEMARLVGEALDAGAVGFSSSRYFRHTAMDGERVPGTYAAEDELVGIAQAMAGRDAVFQVIGGGFVGPEPFAHDLDQPTAPGRRPDVEPSLERELTWMANLSRQTGVRVGLTYAPGFTRSEKFEQGLAFIKAANDSGARLYPQVSLRPTGLLSSFETYHVFMRRPSYLAIAQLPLEARVGELRKPEVKAAILGEEDLPPEPGAHNTTHILLRNALKDTFPMSEPLDFEPTAEKAVPALAAAGGVSVEEQAYDMMLEQDGRARLFSAVTGYYDRNLDRVAYLLRTPGVVIGGSDSGAHVRFICDASSTTFALVHWVRDRSRGERMPLEWMVRKMTSETAHHYGLHDRGVIAPGKRADLNVIDLEALRLEPPRTAYDLPGGGMRFLQEARGYAATFVAGAPTRLDDKDTGARPGRLVRNTARRPKSMAAE